MLIIISLPFVLGACGKDDDPVTEPPVEQEQEDEDPAEPESLPFLGNDTIFPGSFLPIYPKSNWVYENHIGELETIRTGDEYVFTDTSTVFDDPSPGGGGSKPVGEMARYGTMYDQIVFEGYNYHFFCGTDNWRTTGSALGTLLTEQLGPFSNYGNCSAFLYAVVTNDNGETEAIQLDHRFVDRNKDWNVLSIDSTMIVRGTTYTDVLVMKTPSSSLDPIRFMAFAKDVGIIQEYQLKLREEPQPGDTLFYRELVSYEIGPR